MFSDAPTCAAHTKLPLLAYRFTAIGHVLKKFATVLHGILVFYLLAPKDTNLNILNYYRFSLSF